MKRAIYEKRFNYEMECQRFDAPKEDVGKWLEDQAVEAANLKTRGDWVVFKTKLEKQDDGSHTYTVSIMSEATKERKELNPLTCYANLVELVNRCEKIHSYTSWYCMSCDSEVDATFTEHCASCGTPLDGTNLTGNLVEAAKDELKFLLHNQSVDVRSE